MNKREWTYGYEDIRKHTDLTSNSLHQYVRRGDLDPTNLGSIAKFLARHGTLEFRQELLAYAIGHTLAVKPGLKGKAAQEFKKKAAARRARKKKAARAEKT